MLYWLALPQAWKNLTIRPVLLNLTTQAEELKTALAPLIGTNSKISTDTVTNSIIFTGTTTDEMRLRSAVAALDTATQQVTLEAKIIAVNREDSENLGISWNWDKIPQNRNYYGNDDDNDGLITKILAA